MSLLDCKIIFFSFFCQLIQQKGIVPQTDRNQATPRGSLCWSQLLQVQTCWKQKVLQGGFTKAPLRTGQRHRCQGHSMMPINLRIGVSLLEKSGPWFGSRKVLCHSEDAELLLLPPEDHKHSGNRCFQKHLDNLSCLE